MKLYLPDFLSRKKYIIIRISVMLKKTHSASYNYDNFNK